MFIVESALKGFAIQATDGAIGTIKDILFDDSSWKIRWLVVETGSWFSDRQVLLHPSTFGPADSIAQTVPVTLTRQQVRDSPDILQDQPVTRQMEDRLHGHYGWYPGLATGTEGFGLGPVGLFTPPASQHAGMDAAEAQAIDQDAEAGDPHLRSMAAVRGYHILATEGSLGHVEDFLLDDAGWSIRYLVVDTRNWWAGTQVLIAPRAVRAIDWVDREVRLDLTRAQVKSSPPWHPLEPMGPQEEQALRAHYGWPGDAN